MTQNDISQIKRRLNSDKRNPSVIRGLYVTSSGEPITSFEFSVFELDDRENEKYMALFKKALSGQINQNLMTINSIAGDAPAYFDNLMRIRDSALRDEEAVSNLFTQLTSGLKAELHETDNDNNWLILMTHDSFDIQYAGGSAGDSEIEDIPDFSFSYILCAICPVKREKSVLCYRHDKKAFIGRDPDWLAGAPTLGFMFPAYDDGSALMFYTKDSNDTHKAFLNTAFNIEPAMSAAEQSETLQTLLTESLDDECSLNVVHEIHEVVSGLISEQEKDEDPITLTKSDVARVLKESGVSEERIEAFQSGYDEAFGERTQLPAVNVVKSKQYKVELPNVSIKVDPEHTDILETRVIDGRSYLLIPIEGEIAVNGQPVRA